MTTLRWCFVFAAAAALALAGCSDEGTLAPSHDGTGMRGALVSVNIGPSDIVFALDVSDSMSTEEMAIVVNGLGSCVTDGSLIPQDGRMNVAVIVYGDTIATILGRTAVTSETLQNAIIPALQGLLTNRVVPGAGFDLSGALNEAANVLSASSLSDRHVFIAGSGEADDAAAVQAACDAFAASGVEVTALAVGADAEGEALLKACADATGGFFAPVGFPCGDALAFMLQADIDLEPESAELSRNQDHTVTATVFQGGGMGLPVVGAEVIFQIVEGPNATESDTTMTDAQGQALFTFNGDGGPGVDTIVGWTAHPGTGTILSDTVTVTWVNAPPVCDAGGPYVVVVTTDTAQVTLDAGMSSDADGDSLMYHWSVACGEASFDDDTAVSPVLTLTGECLCVDSVTVTLTVNDGFDETTCEAVVTIDDQRPPVIVMREDPIVLWPPNHKFHTIHPDQLIMSAADACGVPIDISSAVVVEVRSDEPDDANGDGRTTGDIRVACPNTVDLRAERMGGGNGRVYAIVYRITGPNGVSADGEGLVVVPHDSSGKPVVADEFGGFVVTPDCEGGTLGR